ncbi:XRE family transcriptional regulator [Streptococcus agalactiae LMG 14747]|uniref:XRE family transcriptional regulator n=1 Tax=Streptococcus agalactiae LMG 14747 TaxID=1154860 RepID=V6Z054_STRAG|nr:XRE family transcriptional regulator [Streptococcus agalactiae LMG 14747]
MTKTAPNRIKALRKEAGLTQQALADHLGLNRQAISSWERGVNSLRVDHAEKVGQFFRVSAGYVLGLTMDKTDHGLRKR